MATWSIRSSLCKFPSARIICLPTLFTTVYAAQCLTQILPSCIHKSLLVHCTTCHGRLSHHLVNGKLFQKEDMFAHKHGPRAPVFTVVMAALSYSTNRPSMFLHSVEAENVCLGGQSYNFVAFNSIADAQHKVWIFHGLLKKKKEEEPILCAYTLWSSCSQVEKKQTQTNPVSLFAFKLEGSQINRTKKCTMTSERIPAGWLHGMKAIYPL